MTGKGAVGPEAEPLAVATCARGGAAIVWAALAVFDGDTGTELT